MGVKRFKKKSRGEKNEIGETMIMTMISVNVLVRIIDYLQTFVKLPSKC
jgi:hypothetical protein